MAEKPGLPSQFKNKTNAMKAKNTRQVPVRRTMDPERMFDNAADDEAFIGGPPPGLTGKDRYQWLMDHPKWRARMIKQMKDEKEGGA